jgi:hypothetical protein
MYSIAATYIRQVHLGMNDITPHFKARQWVIPKPAEAYVARRRHNVAWVQRLRGNAMDARNHIPHDI